LNARRYESDYGPEYLFIKLDVLHNAYTSSDEYALFQETKTKIAILKNFEIVNSTWEYLLLKKMKKPMKLDIQIGSGGEGRISEFVKLEKTEAIQCLYADVEYSFLGKLRRFFFQPPELLIALILEDGSIRNYKAIVPIVNDGIIINKYVSSQGDFESFITFAGKRNMMVVGYKFYTNDEWGFKDKYRWKIKKMILEDRDKSVDIYTPTKLDIPPRPNNGIQYSVEDITQFDAGISIHGWAFSNGMASSRSQTFVVLQSQLRRYIFRCQKINRQDVNDVFAKPQDILGFKAVVFSSKVESGEYRLSLAIQDESGISLVDTNKLININGSSSIIE
jgi:hypothetical protein